ncbi:MAG: 2OG-Fe(II) oxygenase [Rhizobacter sp.]|nr:2OG-Fe(II) oxygenase [Bacteriovorax sp.]
MREKNFIALPLLISTPYIRTKLLSPARMTQLNLQIEDLKLSPSKIFIKNIKISKNTKIRKSISAFYEDKKTLNSIYKKAEKVIEKEWKLKRLTRQESAQIATYRKGDFFNWHVDAPYYEKFFEDQSLDRIMTVILALTDYSEYEGGNVEIVDVLGNKHVISDLNYGEAIIFPSTFKHRVTSIKKGKRKSMTLWLIGQSLSIK